MTRRHATVARLDRDEQASVRELVSAFVSQLIGAVARTLARHVDGYNRQQRQVEVVIDLFDLEPSLAGRL